MSLVDTIFILLLLLIFAALQTLDDLQATVNSFDIKLLKYQKHTEVSDTLPLKPSDGM